MSSDQSPPPKKVYFVKHSDSTYKYIKIKIKKMHGGVPLYIDNVFVVVFIRSSDNPLEIAMGTNCAPLTADLFSYT
jgi:hypothetical protein